MEKHVNYELCKAWDGVCCQQNGYIYLPNYFKRLSFNYLLKQLEEKMQIIEEKHSKNEELKDMDCQLLE